MRNSTGWRPMIPAVIIMLLAAACQSGSGESPSVAAQGSADASTAAASAAPSSGEPASSEAATADLPELVDGKLPPLEDGFPDSPITLWSAFEPGHADDLFNNTVSQIAADYSPVRITTQANPMGPHLHYDLVDFLRDQQLAEEGYHAYSIGWFGLTVRPYTIESLAEAEITDLQPINIMEDVPFVFAVRSDSPHESLEDVAAAAAETEMNAVASSAGSGLHSSLLVWAAQEELTFNFVPTDGSGQSKQTLLGEGAELAVLVYEPGLEDEVKILAVTGGRPVSTLPDVPTTEELGFNIPSGSYRGYGTLPEVSEEHRQWLDDLFRLVVADERFAEQRPGFEIVHQDAEEVAALRENVLDVFIPVLVDAGVAVRDR